MVESVDFNQSVMTPNPEEFWSPKIVFFFLISGSGVWGSGAFTDWLKSKHETLGSALF